MKLVYQPAEDSYLLGSVIPNYAKNKIVLDMCSGAGILAVEALKYKAKRATAVDINKDAVELIKKQNKNIGVIKSNLFSKVKGKFDLIICNPPYLPEDNREDKSSKVATTGGKNGDEFIIKFLKQSKSHVAKNGIILLLLSSLTPRNKINKLLIKLNLKSKTIAQKSLFFEKLEVLEIRQHQYLNTISLSKIHGARAKNSRITD